MIYSTLFFLRMSDEFIYITPNDIFASSTYVIPCNYQIVQQIGVYIILDKINSLGVVERKQTKNREIK